MSTHRRERISLARKPKKQEQAIYREMMNLLLSYNFLTKFIASFHSRKSAVVVEYFLLNLIQFCWFTIDSEC